MILADSLRRPLSSATKVANYMPLPSPRFETAAFGDAVADLIAQQDVTLVIPTCEEVFYLAALWEARDMDARLLAPSLALLRKVHHKYDFIQLCQSLDLPIPKTYLLQSSDDLAAVADRSQTFVFKPVWSRFGTNVRICPASGRLKITPSETQPWVAQEFVSGREICVYGLARKGEVMAVSAYAPTYRAGAGAGIYFEPVTSSAARDFVQKFVAGTLWDGQVSFDLIEGPDGTVTPIECNPRTISGVHFFRDGPAFWTALEGRSIAAPDGNAPQTLPMAMWLYGLPHAIRSGQVRAFCGDLQRAEHLLDWPDDPGPKRAQVRALIEIAGRAMRQRVSLQAAATADIEWNG